MPADPALKHWPAYAARVLARLEANVMATPPNRTTLQLLDELQQELEDVCGWAVVLSARIERLKAAVGQAYAREPE